MRDNPYYLLWGGWMPLVGVAAFAVSYYRNESIPWAIGSAAVAPVYLPYVLWDELSD